MSKVGRPSRLTRAFLAGGVGAAVLGGIALAGLATRSGQTPPPLPGTVARVPAPTPAGTTFAGPTAWPTFTPAPTATPRQAAAASSATDRARSGGPHYALRGLDGRTISPDSQRGKVTVLFFIVPG